ncbi:acyl carrier protein [Actinokineospora sp. G85]|uniref:acyl carrier protein n=1 Tax=Actinokineospora sp. G85 TaxID=3406626 RepID=UPI003C72026A
MRAAGDEITGRVRRLVASVLEVEEDEVGPDASFHDELEVDSLQKAEIVARVEREFGVRVDVEAAAGLRSAADVVVLVGALDRS